MSGDDRESLLFQMRYNGENSAELEVLLGQNVLLKRGFFLEYLTVEYCEAMAC